MKIGDEIYYLDGPEHADREDLIPKIGTLLYWGQEMTVTMIDNIYIPILTIVGLVCDKVDGNVKPVLAENIMTRESKFLPKGTDETQNEDG